MVSGVDLGYYYYYYWRRAEWVQFEALRLGLVDLATA